ncbi:peptidoglycan-N-acetylglucosamine deacetylase [bacterium BMS3Abin03]|nr:peptidoglycan-N-acetylglucosamine deacetylase [bacterium BMS3Abin03]
MRYLYNPPSIVKFIFKEFYWETVNDKILLTFDDGPDPGTTEKILTALSDLKIKALFFCVGNNIKLYPGLTKAVIDEGHTIGNHTFNHKIITKYEGNDYITEIENFNKMMLKDYSSDVKYFRPPHGKFNFRTKKTIKLIEMKCVMWNLLTYDYKNDFKKVKFAVDKYLKQNSIIVLHDSLKSEEIILDSIKYTAEAADKRNYKFGEPDECLS